MRKYLPEIYTAPLTLAVVIFFNRVFFPQIFDSNQLQENGLSGLSALGISITLLADLLIVLIAFPLIDILLRKYYFKNK